MTVYTQISQNNWPSAKNQYDDYLVLNCPFYSGTQSNSLILQAGSRTIKAAKVPSAANNSFITSAQSKFYGQSLRLTGSGAQLVYASSTDFDMKAGDYTIELWLNADNYSTTYSLVTRGAYSALPSTPGFGMHLTGNRVSLYYGSSEFFTTNVLTAGVWHHVALVQSGSTQTIYIDGVARGSGSLTRTADATGQNLDIGHSNSVWGANYPFPGYMQDLRIYKGVAKYTSSFTPPGAFLSSY